MSFNFQKGKLTGFFKYEQTLYKFRHFKTCLKSTVMNER